MDVDTSTLNEKVDAHMKAGEEDQHFGHKVAASLKAETNKATAHLKAGEQSKVTDTQQDNTEQMDSDVKGNSDYDYTQVRSKYKRKRISSNETNSGNQHIGNTGKQPQSHTTRTVYISGQGFNLAKSLELKNARSFKHDMTQIIGTPESIDCKGDAVCVICRDDEQKQKLLKLKEIDSKKVTVSLHGACKSEKRKTGIILTNPSPGTEESSLEFR